MIGYVVRHRQLGLGKIETAQHGAFSIRFVTSGQLMPFAYGQFGNGGSLTREVLGLGSRCRSADGECVVERVARRPASPADPYTYTVVFANGDVRVLSEQDLHPIPGGESSDPQVRFGGLQLHPSSLFASREGLRRSYAGMMRDAAGLRALLGSRVDLRPHQAFVAGTVLLEPRRRFILADEVGLGKTIEAGIVIHDLLAQQPDARILVLCPGALTQQWLCEMYAKFGGHVFTLLDLHDPDVIEWAKCRLVISSTTMAAFRAGPALERVRWDMVVVDEAHHLLTMPALYTHVERLSRRAPAALLLSAIPAHERADELLRLLALLEPERYGAFTAEARAAFAALHEQQPAIGQGLRVLERRIAALEAGEIEPNDACAVARRILETPAIGTDHELVERLAHLERGCAVEDGSRQLAGALATSDSNSIRSHLAPSATASELARATAVESPHDRAGEAAARTEQAEGAARRARANVAQSLRRWAHDVADRYRLSRRILRNRRTRLIELQQIAPIERRVDLRPYAPHRLEAEAAEGLELLLRAAHGRCESVTEEHFVAAFAKMCWQSAGSPAGLPALLARLKKTTPRTLNARGIDFLAMGQAVGYAEWALYRDLLMRAVRQAMPEEALDEALRGAIAWRDTGVGAWTRLRALLELLEARAGDRPKLILFAGYPGLARDVAGQLEEALGADAVATFRAEQSLDEKETNALRFQQDSKVWLLVSDESGGEGRNFQFAAELVHVDTPWHAARIEQRIGRLDRLGRERVRADVMSRVLYNDASVEAGLVHSLDQALGVYRQSISGLEFALREVERTIVANALSGGVDAMLQGTAQLAAVVGRERERDDAEAVWDEASYDASAAGRFRAIARSDRLDAAIESAMVDYMRHLTEGRGVRKLDTPYGPGAVVRFQPEKTCFGALPVDETGAEFLAGNYDGTFRRQVAQQAPRLHFFNVGDPLFNAVINSLDRHATGRAFGIEVYAPGRQPWVGLECRFIPRLDPTLLGGSAGLRNRLDALFVPKPLAVLVDLHGALLPAADADAIVALRRRAEQAQRGQTWWDLAEVGPALARALNPDTWPDAVAALVGRARDEATRLLEERLSGPLSAERSRVAAIVGVLEEAAGRGDQDAAGQALQYAAYAAALTLWQVSLDALGLVSINGRLRLGRLE